MTDIPPDQYAQAYVEAASVHAELEQLVARIRTDLEAKAPPQWLEARVVSYAAGGRIDQVLIGALMELALRGWPEVTVYAVKYSNYEPPEIAGMYLTAVAAQQCADHLNRTAQTTAWVVCTWTVKSEYDPRES